MKFLQAPKIRLVCSDLSSKLNLTGWYNVPVNHISFWDNDTLKTGNKFLRFIMTPHVHHWDSMMIFEETTKSLFTSDLFIQSGDNHKVVISKDLSENMINLYRAVGIFAREQPVRNPRMVYPMHGSCLDSSVFPRYVEAIMNKDFAYTDMLLGQKLL
jgi:flavorubredoxin